MAPIKNRFPNALPPADLLQIAATGCSQVRHLERTTSIYRVDEERGPLYVVKRKRSKAIRQCCDLSEIARAPGSVGFGKELSNPFPESGCPLPTGRISCVFQSRADCRNPSLAFRHRASCYCREFLALILLCFDKSFAKYFK